MIPLSMLDGLWWVPIAVRTRVRVPSMTNTHLYHLPVFTSPFSSHISRFLSVFCPHCLSWELSAPCSFLYQSLCTYCPTVPLA